MGDTVFLSPRFSGNATLRDVLNGRATLKRGSIGEAVRIVQQALIDLGESMPSGADGNFGPQTQNAVSHYQTTRGLTADGIVGRNTMSRLDANIVAFEYTNNATIAGTVWANMLTVAIHGSTAQELQAILMTEPYDFGCKPYISPTPNGDFILTALVTPTQFASLRTQPRQIDIVFENLSPERMSAITVARGDRFNGGSVAPRGIGTQPNASANLGRIMNVDEIDSAIKGLVREYGISTFSLGATAEGSIGNGGLVSGANPQDYHIYFTAGVHARERGGPDNLIYFISDLLYAQKHRTGLTYGQKSYSNADVLRVISAGIVFFPLVNPDGVRFDQITDCGWRKNRNRASATPGEELSVGVDINRNYDFLWNFSTQFHRDIRNKVASDDPNTDIFHGTSPFSEPESRNMDIHSAQGVICYNWGNDDNSDNPNQTFQNRNDDGKRGIVGDSLYREYIAPNDLNNITAVAKRVAQSMGSVGARSYKDVQSTKAGVASGASDDYAFSRNKVDATKNKVYGFTMEFGYPTNFYPTLTEFHENVMDTGAGFIEFCLAAADIGLV